MPSQHVRAVVGGARQLQQAAQATERGDLRSLMRKHYAANDKSRERRAVEGCG